MGSSNCLGPAGNWVDWDLGLGLMFHFLLCEIIIWVIIYPVSVRFGFFFSPTASGVKFTSDLGVEQGVGIKGSDSYPP
jgi:hypothetical protein